MWRDLLGEIVITPAERQRVAHELGVSPITLTRWISGESRPRLHNVKSLLEALPAHREQLLQLLLTEFGSAFVEEIDEDAAPGVISAAFYARVIQAHCALPRVTHLHTLCDLILTQAVMQFDPNRSGLQISLLLCMPPPPDQPVRSLREYMTRASYPLRSELDQPGCFLGYESLAGYALVAGRMFTTGTQGNAFWLAGSSAQIWGESAIACPFVRANAFAGCLLISSMLTDYFALPLRQSLAQNYADLLSAIFPPDIFYTREGIEPGIMPPVEKQLAHIRSLRPRMFALMRQSSLNSVQAEKVVLQQIEEELLSLLQK